MRKLWCRLCWKPYGIFPRTTYFLNLSHCRDKVLQMLSVCGLLIKRFWEINLVLNGKEKRKRRRSRKIAENCSLCRIMNGTLKHKTFSPFLLTLPYIQFILVFKWIKTNKSLNGKSKWLSSLMCVLFRKQNSNHINIFYRESWERKQLTSIRSINARK